MWNEVYNGVLEALKTMLTSGYYLPIEIKETENEYDPDTGKLANVTEKKYQAFQRVETPPDINTLKTCTEVLMKLADGEVPQVPDGTSQEVGVIILPEIKGKEADNG